MLLFAGDPGAFAANVFGFGNDLDQIVNMIFDFIPAQAAKSLAYFHWSFLPFFCSMMGEPGATMSNPFFSNWLRACFRQLPLFYLLRQGKSRSE
jgi:hypothetical protein